VQTQRHPPATPSDDALAAGDWTLQVYRSLASAETEWRAFESRAAGHPYQCFDWLAAWHAGIRTGDVQPFIVVVREQGHTRMLLPLAIERHLGMRRLAPMGAPVCDYHGPLIDPEFAQRLTREQTHRLLMAVVALAGVDYALLARVPPTLGAVRNPFSDLALRRFSADAHATFLGPDWETFYAARRSAATRSRLRGKEKALAKSGAIAFAEVTDPQERVRLASQMMALKASHLTPTAGAFNIFARADVQQFFRALAGQAPADAVRLFKLTAGDVLVAAALGMVRERCFYYEVPVYANLPLQRHSPGHLLLTRLMEWAIAQGCTRFDFTVGDEAYKAEWCDETWELRCGAWPRTFRGRIGAGIALAEIAATRRIKQHPGLYAFAVRVRTLVARAQRVLKSAHA
jgi:CelD/BcsL family acetyltransferase involved in cellulose biosynthesis